MTINQLPLLALLASSAVGFAQAAEPDYDASAKAVWTLLSELVAADTTSPPGNEARAVLIGAARLKEAGIPFEITEFAPGRQNLVARIKGTGTKKPLLLIAHIDVVGAQDQPWTSAPHEVTEKNGTLVGRGVHDDLGMAAIALETILILKRTQPKLERDVILAWTGDEESGGLGVQYILKNKPGSITAELAFNEGGGLELGENGKVKLISLQMAEKIYADFDLVATGPTGHSSVPLKDNAIYRLSAALARLGEQQAPARLLPVTRAYFAARAKLEAEPLASAMKALSEAPGALPAGALEVIEADPSLAASLRTTCVATMLGGGTRVNALPAQAKANINCRMLPDETIDDIKARLSKAIADDKIEIRPTELPGKAGPSPVDGPGPRAIAAVAARMFPGAPIIPEMSRGATDSRFLREAGIAAYGINPIAVTEEDGRRAHGIDERIPTQSLRQGVEFFHRLVLEAAR